MPEILFKEESYKLIGACFEVYNEKGYASLDGGPGHVLDEFNASSALG